jgi:hypothetical protein
VPKGYSGEGRWMLENWLFLEADVALSKAVCGKALCAKEKVTCLLTVFTVYTEMLSYRLYRISKSVASLTAYFQHIKPQWKNPFK